MEKQLCMYANDSGINEFDVLWRCGRHNSRDFSLMTYIYCLATDFGEIVNIGVICSVCMSDLPATQSQGVASDESRAQLLSLDCKGCL
jgi:hypothetical protein